MREHLLLYGRLKGIPRGPELDRNVDDLLKATDLAQYTDRLASQLSGGNQRKLALAIAMIGSLWPSVFVGVFNELPGS